ncbi:hypothetical protein EHI47_07295 [Rhizobium leguminosarum]|uniref:Uncharacterized protein n=1 Tax=Rhizobium leguminosarum TaxID=384 RepID=A0A444I770_RHILE|nr:hypothetical protein [Rhizobium leguminosarum]RWX34196.1 hypothetical protein EHI47_07295 [Rhizobium leguminosarum]
MVITKMVSFRPAVLAIPILLSGCTAGPDYVPPELAIPAKFSEGRSRSIGDVGGNTWWAAYDDKEPMGVFDFGGSFAEPRIEFVAMGVLLPGKELADADAVPPAVVAMLPSFFAINTRHAEA